MGKVNQSFFDSLMAPLQRRGLALMQIAPDQMSPFTDEEEYRLARHYAEKAGRGGAVSLGADVALDVLPVVAGAVAAPVLAGAVAAPVAAAGGAGVATFGSMLRNFIAQRGLDAVEGAASSYLTVPTERGESRLGNAAAAGLFSAATGGALDAGATLAPQGIKFVSGIKKQYPELMKKFYSFTKSQGKLRDVAGGGEYVSEEAKERIAQQLLSGLKMRGVNVSQSFKSSGIDDVLKKPNKIADGLLSKLTERQKLLPYVEREGLNLAEAMKSENDLYEAIPRNAFEDAAIKARKQAKRTGGNAQRRDLLEKAEELSALGMDAGADSARYADLTNKIGEDFSNLRDIIGTDKFNDPSFLEKKAKTMIASAAKGDAAALDMLIRNVGKAKAKKILSTEMLGGASTAVEQAVNYSKNLKKVSGSSATMKKMFPSALGKGERDAFQELSKQVSSNTKPLDKAQLSAYLQSLFSGTTNSDTFARTLYRTEFPNTKIPAAFGRNNIVENVALAARESIPFLPAFAQRQNYVSDAQADIMAEEEAISRNAAIKSAVMQNNGSPKATNSLANLSKEDVKALVLKHMNQKGK